MECLKTCDFSTFAEFGIRDFFCKKLSHAMSNFQKPTFFTSLKIAFQAILTPPEPSHFAQYIRVNPPNFSLHRSRFHNIFFLAKSPTTPFFTPKNPHNPEKTPKKPRKIPFRHTGSPWHPLRLALQSAAPRRFSPK